MAYNLRVLLHVLGLLATVLLLAWCALNTRYFATMLVLGLLLVAQVASLLRLVHTTNRELERFLQALHYMDFTQRFRSSVHSSSSASLSSSFNHIMERFLEARGEREREAAWLQALIQHLPVAVMVLDEQERILRTNTALLRLLRRNTPPSSLDLFSGPASALADAVRALQAGNERMHELVYDGETLQLKLSCTLLRTGGLVQKLVCIQNIEGELEGRELDAWQNLIRVMTHEIMNSVTPLTSLADTAEQCVMEGRSLLAANDASSRDRIEGLLEDTQDALQIISKRGQGLVRFVTSYRKLARVPKPVPAVIDLHSAFQRIQDLLAETLRTHDVRMVIDCRPQSLQLVADGEQLDQALINLLHNALDAVVEVADPRISLQASLEAGGIITLTVSDNGCGIDAANLDNIFIPFFTTKRGGSGIGMSLAKQIVRANGGRISVESTLAIGTRIRLSFRQY